MYMPIENRSEYHLPCVILCDVSGTMAPYMGVLNQEIVKLLRSIFKNGVARGRVEVCIIAFDHEVQMVKGFQSLYDYHDNGYELPPLKTRNGMTATHAAMRAALDEVNLRRDQYDREGVRHYHPAFFLLTDGKATDTPDARGNAFEELLQLQKDRHWIYFPVAIGDDCDTEELARYQDRGFVAKIGQNEQDIAKVFSSISMSIVKIGTSRPGDWIDVPFEGQVHSVQP